MDLWFIDTLSFATFNTAEACFWIVIGISCFFVSQRAPKRYHRVSLCAGIIFVLFGISDVMEVIYGSFLEDGLLWLFAWKILSVIGILYVIGWYLYLRLNEEGN